MALGVAPELWETTTPRELIAVMERIAELREADMRAANNRAGVIAATIAQGTLKKRGGGNWTAEDFFRERKELTTDQLRSKMRAIAGQLNSKDSA